MVCSFCGEDLTPGESCMISEGAFFHEECLARKSEKNSEALIYKCASCNGTGQVSREQKRRSEFDLSEAYEKCHLCNGEGKTKDRYRPVLEITGYKKK